MGLIPGLIAAGFRQVDRRFARVFAEITELRNDVDERFGHVDERFEAMIRAVAAGRNFLGLDRPTKAKPTRWRCPVR